VAAPVKRAVYQEAERHPQNAQTPARTSETGVRGRVEVIFGEDNPAGGYEVLSKPRLGKCSINTIKFYDRLPSVYIFPSTDQNVQLLNNHEQGIRAKVRDILVFRRMILHVCCLEDGHPSGGTTPP
jgi:hypothetical protein